MGALYISPAPRATGHAAGAHQHHRGGAGVLRGGRRRGAADAGGRGARAQQHGRLRGARVHRGERGGPVRAAAVSGVCLFAFAFALKALTEGFD